VEYIALSIPLRDVIYIMQLLEELLSFGILHIPVTTPTVHCKVFRDNVVGAIELINAPNHDHR
jgi:hypothetical protein